MPRFKPAAAALLLSCFAFRAVAWTSETAKAAPRFSNPKPLPLLTSPATAPQLQIGSTPIAPFKTILPAEETSRQPARLPEAKADPQTAPESLDRQGRALFDQSLTDRKEIVVSAAEIGSNPAGLEDNREILARFQAAHRDLSESGKPRIAFVTLVSPDYDVPSFNLATAELAGYLRHQNPELAKGIHFIEPDITLSRTDRLKDSVQESLIALRRIKPQIIGLSAKIGSQGNLLSLMDALKAEPWAKNSVIMVGNVLSTFSHDKISQRHPEALYALADGELTVDAVYQAVKSGSVSLAAIPNLAVREGDRIFQTPRRMLDHNQVTWLPALDMLNTAMAHKSDIILRATTGCPACCTFCSIKSINKETDKRGALKDMGWESYPAGRTARLFNILQRRGVKYVNLGDDEFGNTDFGFIREFADRLIAQGNTVKFNVSMRLDAWWTPKMDAGEIEERRQVLRRLVQAGLSQLFVGAESGSRTQLRRYGKGYDVNVNEHALKILIKEGVTPSVGFIPFDQFVNRDEVLENLAFLDRDIDGRRFYEFVSSPLNVMRVQRDTPYQRLMQKRGLLGELEPNLSFYRSDFVDPRMGKVAMLAQDWFREIMDLRYPTIQLYRMSKGSHSFSPGIYLRSRELTRRMHQLDTQYVKALLKVFPRDKFDLAFQGRAAEIFLKSSPELEAARLAWNREVAEKVGALRQVRQAFRAKRLAIETEMKELLEEAYGKAP